jgi:hypothetical protein
MDKFEIITGIEYRNRYEIRKADGLCQLLYRAAEFGQYKGLYDVLISDIKRRRAIQLFRPSDCYSTICRANDPEMKIYSPPGVFIGLVEKIAHRAIFRVKNPAQDTIMTISGPSGLIARTSFGNEINFKILSLNGNEIGRITKHWSGMVREVFTDADDFSITFPLDMDVELKAVILGACIFIVRIN